MSIKEFFSKCIFAGRNVKQTIRQNVALKNFMFDIFEAFLVIDCIIVFKIPRDENNSMLLNSFYFFVIAFFLCMQIDRVLQKANDESYKMSLVVKIIYWVTLFFGLYLCCMHWEYINQHFAEWGSFNKVGKSL